MKKRISEILKKLTCKIRCDEESLKNYLSVMGQTACSESELKKYMKTVDRRYFTVILFTAVFMLISIIISVSQSQIVENVERSSVYGKEQSIQLEVEAEYKGQRVKGPVKIDIPSEEMTEEEILDILHQYSDTLTARFPQTEEGSLYAVSDIDLPKHDDRYGIDITWSSSDPVIFSDDGKINVISLAEEEEVIIMSAELSMQGISIVKEFEVLLMDDPEAYEASISRTVKEIVSDISKNKEDKIIKLPGRTSEGITLTWRKKGESYTLGILCLGAAVFLYMYMSRYKGAQKAVQKYKRDISASFPSVPERMLLLIDSGMTSHNALMRISEDIGSRSDDKITPFAGEMAEIVKRVETFNASLIQEWKEFSARMQSADMLRFCAIVEDNITKGSDIYAKLQLECRNLRESRKKAVQEKMRLMDSKLMMPMMLMLFSLIIVAAGPAVMEF